MCARCKIRRLISWTLQSGSEQFSILILEMYSRYFDHDNNNHLLKDRVRVETDWFNERTIYIDNVCKTLSIRDQQAGLCKKDNNNSIYEDLRGIVLDASTICRLNKHHTSTRFAYFRLNIAVSKAYCQSVRKAKRKTRQLVLISCLHWKFFLSFSFFCAPKSIFLVSFYSIWVWRRAWKNYPASTKLTLVTCHFFNR